jgi:hypothetical protein
LLVARAYPPLTTVDDDSESGNEINYRLAIRDKRVKESICLLPEEKIV